MKKNKKTLLWSIEDQQSKVVSYVFGTMHIMDMKAFVFQDMVKEKMDACQVFATELNFEQIELIAGEQDMSLPEDQTLQDILSEKSYKKVKKAFEKITGMDIAFFNKKLPIMINNIMSESILSKDMPHSLDKSLWLYATQQEKITMGIETYAEQLEILAKIPLEYQVKSLLGSCKNISKFRKSILKTTALYEQGDIQKLYKYSKKSLKGIKKVMLYDRNNIMAERIAKIASEQSIFAAIGAGHLGGEKGVLKLLKQIGFKVKPVKAN